MVDLNGLAKRYLGTNQSPIDSQEVGGVTITNDSGSNDQSDIEDPHHAFVGDGIHPGTVVQAGIANMVVEAFREGLRELGYVEGQNITIEQRYAGGVAGRLPGLLCRRGFLWRN